MTDESSTAEKHLAISRQRLKSALFSEQRTATQVKPIAYLSTWIRLGLQIWQSRSAQSKVGWQDLQIMFQILKLIANKRPLALVTVALMAGAVLARSGAWRRYITPLVLQAGFIFIIKKLSSTHSEVRPG